MNASAENLRLVGRFYNDLWNRFDTSVAAEILAPDVTLRSSLGQFRRGHAEFAKYIEFVRTAFPDFHNELVETITEGNKTFAHLHYSGTHRGEIFGVPPTGKRVRYDGAAVFTITDGLISDVWVLGDVYGLLEQLRGPNQHREQ